jgi:hypothetical protein
MGRWRSGSFRRVKGVNATSAVLCVSRDHWGVASSCAARVWMVFDVTFVAAGLLGRAGVDGGRGYWMKRTLVSLKVGKRVARFGSALATTYTTTTTTTTDTDGVESRGMYQFRNEEQPRRGEARRGSVATMAMACMVQRDGTSARQGWFGIACVRLGSEERPPMSFAQHWAVLWFGRCGSQPCHPIVVAWPSFCFCF